MPKNRLKKRAFPASLESHFCWPFLVYANGRFYTKIALVFLLFQRQATTKICLFLAMQASDLGTFLLRFPNFSTSVLLVVSLLALWHSFSSCPLLSLMRSWILYSCVLLFSCAQEPEKKESVVFSSTDTLTQSAPVVTTADTDISFARDTVIQKKPKRTVLKRPSGTYRFLLPAEGGEKILHTVVFYPGTFRLQEEYNRDSIVVTEGTWAPSHDFIWLYKDQVVRGRYTWKGDTLQYFSPQQNKTFSMTWLAPVTTNAVWQTKRREGKRLYGIGTEPFWSVEITKNDSIVVNMPDWKAPLRVKITESMTTTDSAVFRTGSDSLRLVVYPYFCSDGMSDFLYTKRLELVYNGQTYRGCGEFLHSSH